MDPTDDYKVATLWVPKTFFPEIDLPTTDPKSKSIYLLPASHRGDMYHIRAAMILEPHPLLIYECSETTKDLQKYLEAAVVSPQKHAFLTPWDWEQLINEKNPASEEEAGKYTRREITFFTEAGATKIIRKIMDDQKGNEKIKAKLAEGMAMIVSDGKNELRQEMDTLCQKLFKGAPKKSEKTILIQCRDTGTKGGIYPELDSGKTSVEQIATWIRQVPKQDKDDNAVIKVALCGNTERFANLDGIGEYFKEIWTHIDPKWSKGETTKRDVEAFFLKVAFEKGYFHMVVGFRSGALDLFTFLGIPSISISVRQMVGEGRHGDLATVYFQRWNIQYELPRQGATKYHLHRNQWVLGSPYWKFGEGTQPPSDDEKQELLKPPTGFHVYDSEIVRIGIYNAIVVLLPWKPVTPFIKPQVQNRVFCNTTCRPCYFSDLSWKSGIRDFWTRQQGLERADFKTRKANMGWTEEPEGEVRRWEKQMEDEWAALLKKVKDDNTQH